LSASWDGARNILCVRLDAMGDVLMTTPALRALKQLERSPRLTLCTSSAGAAIAALIPEVDAILSHPVPWMKASAERDPDADLAFVARLRAARFDAAVIFTVYSQSPLPAALLCHLADIPLRLAYCRENPYHLLSDWVPESEPEQGIRHEVQRQLDLVAHVGAHGSEQRLSLRIPPAALQRARHMLELLGVRTRRPWIAIHPGASARSRRYPEESFAAAASRLASDGWQIVFIGAEQERDRIARMQRAIPYRTCSAAGWTDLPELAALISLAPLMIANNSGPAHVAAAVGTPLVDLYALTNPQHTPWQVPHRVLSHDVPCRHCYKSSCPAGHHACLRGVSPEQVVSAVRALALEVGIEPPVKPRAQVQVAPRLLHMGHHAYNAKE
jgi:lipopolysaccharide heptosyltransferase II